MEPTEEQDKPSMEGSHAEAEANNNVTPSSEALTATSPPVTAPSITSPRTTAGQSETSITTAPSSNAAPTCPANPATTTEPPPEHKPDHTSPSPPKAMNLHRKPTGPPTLPELCKIGGVEVSPPRAPTVDPHTREEIKYMYVHEYADGLNKLLETQWYTTNGLERLFANFTLQQQFAGTLQLFGRTKSTSFDEYLRLPPMERKLVLELMLLPMKVPGPNPSDTELQTVISRLHVLECLLTGRTIQSSPIIGGLPQPGMDPRQSHFWKHLGECVTQSTLCNMQYGIPTWPEAYRNASGALSSMRQVLDGMENRDVLYSMAVLRHLGPRHLPNLGRGESAPPGSEKERSMVAVAKKFLEDQASGWGTTQVIQRVCGMVMTGLNHWGLL